MGTVFLCLSIMGLQSVILAISCLLSLQGCLGLPAVQKDGLPPINWENIKPRMPTFTPYESAKDLPQELLAHVLNMKPQVTERMSGYKKGSKSFAGECGIPGGQERIVGGAEATPHSYPWMAALFIDDAWFCGGTLISDEWVLTAAHCTTDAHTARVLLGAHNVREAQEEGRVEMISTDIITHEKYNSFNLHNDIGLIHLPEKVNFTDILKPVCLPSHSEEDERWAGEDCQASGWGKPSDSADSISPVLREVTVDTITNLICALQFPTIINHNIICISGHDGKSTCNGDSGGPLHLVQDGVYKQIGITSFGSSMGCEIGSHAGFTRPTSFLDWIETNTGILIDP